MIRKIDKTIEVMAMVMDSFAKQYDCRVLYDKETGAVSFEGDDEYRHYINVDFIKICLFSRNLDAILNTMPNIFRKRDE